MKRELLKLALHNYLDRSILGDEETGYELWCPGGLTEPAKLLLDTWPMSWAQEELTDDAAIVIAETAAFQGLDWTTAGTAVLGAFTVRPSYVEGVDISIKVRNCFPVHESFFQGKIVMDPATTLDAVRRVVEDTQLSARQDLEVAKMRADEAIRRAEAEKDRATEGTARSDRLSLTIASRAMEASLDGRLDQARADFEDPVDGSSHPATLFLAFHFYYRTGDMSASTWSAVAAGTERRRSSPITRDRSPRPPGSLPTGPAFGFLLARCGVLRW